MKLFRSFHLILFVESLLSANKMFSDFKKILNSGFSYKKSLERENVKQESVDLLREKLKNSKIVPKSLTDKQVNVIFDKI